MPTTGPPLRIRVTREAGTPVLHLSGELDISTGPLLRGRLQDLLGPGCDPVDRLVVDCTELEFADVAGLGVLLRAERALAARGGSVVLRHPSSMVRRVVRVLELGDRLHVEEPG